MRIPDDPGDVETLTVEVFGGPYDGGLLHVPRVQDGTYDSNYGALGVWGGIPIRERAGDYALILDWFELMASAIVFPECRSLMSKLQALSEIPPPRP